MEDRNETGFLLSDYLLSSILSSLSSLFRLRLTQCSLPRGCLVSKRYSPRLKIYCLKIHCLKIHWLYCCSHRRPLPISLPYYHCDHNP